MSKAALIIGGSVAGLQAALDLADSGIEVYLVEQSPFLRKNDTDTIPKHLLNTRFLEVEKHPNIRLWTNTSINLKRVEGESGFFLVELRRHPRYVDLNKCTACGDCLTVCPVVVPNTDRKAIFIGGQPGVAAIEKLGIAPCRGACPTHQRAQGYIALIRQKRFADAYWAIRREHPFPSVCGRVCNHRCEDVCTRGRYDEPVNIMGLKRFVSDWAYSHRDELPNLRNKSLVGTPFQHQPRSTGKRVAVIGAGPAGLTAALDLVHLGHAVTVFDALPVAGGMMRVGIPPHRLPDHLLDWEIQQIVDEGVELKLNVWVNDIPGLLDRDYNAVLIATGAHKAKKLPLRNSNHPDNWLSLDVLRRIRLGEKIDLNGKRIIVLGGGNVALDTARTVLRLGANEVSIVCLEPHGEMPGFKWEIKVAEEEGIQIFPGRIFKEIVVMEEKIVGVQCVEIIFHGFKAGRPDVNEIPGTEHVLPADLVIWAIGQGPDFSFLPQDGSINTRYPVGIQSDVNMMTTMSGVFVAGDVHRGVTFFVVDAIEEGHRVARSIDQYLRGLDSIPESILPPVVELNESEIETRFKGGDVSRNARVPISSIPLEERIHNFHEVDLTLTEQEALGEAERCLRCAICSECLECLAICERKAIDHDMQEDQFEFEAGAIIFSDDPARNSWIALSDDDRFYCVSPDDALLGSALAAHTMLDLYAERRPMPVASNSILIEDPVRIGVFICECGGEISQVVDIDLVCEGITVLPDVIHVQVLPFSCSPDVVDTIGAVVDKYNLNRVVLAACSCCPMAQVCFSCAYQRVRCKQSLGLYSSVEDASSGSLGVTQKARFEFVNIREQCAWVHSNDPQAATTKATTLVAAAISRVRAAPIRLASAHRIDRSVLVLGNGEAARFCWENLSRQGIHVQHVVGETSQVSRAGGQYIVIQGEKTWHASALVLTPVDDREKEHLLVEFGRERRRPLVHSYWGGLETHRPGVILCDPDQDPRIVGAAAAARVIAWLYRTENRPPIAAVVDADRCRACKTCIDTCEFGAPELVEENNRHHAWIDPAICTGCGTCAAHCPSGAITAGCSTDLQLEAMLCSFLSPTSLA